MWPADATDTLSGDSVVLTAVHAKSRYELVKLEQDPPEGISASPEDPKANMFVWNASIFDGLGQYDGGYVPLPHTCRSFVGMAFLVLLKGRRLSFCLRLFFGDTSRVFRHVALLLQDQKVGARSWH
jgi:hypothetical protein